MLEIKEKLKKLSKPDLMILLSTYTLMERKIEKITDKQIREVIEENSMNFVSKADIVIEILNSRERLGIKEHVDNTVDIY